jgi:5-methylcytosine-specific restriction endonuclease McrA
MTNLKEDHLGNKRSDQWPKVRAAHLLKENWCRNCGTINRLEVHHVQPFHLHPELELDPTNFITLCEDSTDGAECHLKVGHLGNWKNFNPQVREIANSPGPSLPASHIVAAIPK